MSFDGSTRLKPYVQVKGGRASPLDGAVAEHLSKTTVELVERSHGACLLPLAGNRGPAVHCDVMGDTSFLDRDGLASARDMDSLYAGEGLLLQNISVLEEMGASGEVKTLGLYY